MLESIASPAPESYRKMIVRTAHFIGSVHPDHQSEFNQHCDAEVLPLLNRFPGILSAAIERPFSSDPGAAPIYQIYRLRFPDEAAMAGALDSPVRAQVHEAMAAILPWFDGEIVHYVAHVTA